MDDTIIYFFEKELVTLIPQAFELKHCGSDMAIGLADLVEANQVSLLRAIDITIKISAYLSQQNKDKRNTIALSDRKQSSIDIVYIETFYKSFVYKLHHILRYTGLNVISGIISCSYLFDDGLIKQLQTSLDEFKDKELFDQLNAKWSNVSTRLVPDQDSQFKSKTDIHDFHESQRISDRLEEFLISFESISKESDVKAWVESNKLPLSQMMNIKPILLPWLANQFLNIFLSSSKSRTIVSSNKRSSYHTETNRNNVESRIVSNSKKTKNSLKSSGGSYIFDIYSHYERYAKDFSGSHSFVYWFLLCVNDARFNQCLFDAINRRISVITTISKQSTNRKALFNTFNASEDLADPSSTYNPSDWSTTLYRLRSLGKLLGFISFHHIWGISGDSMISEDNYANAMDSDPIVSSRHPWTSFIFEAYKCSSLFVVVPWIVEYLLMMKHISSNQSKYIMMHKDCFDALTAILRSDDYSLRDDVSSTRALSSNKIFIVMEIQRLFAEFPSAKSDGLNIKAKFATRDAADSYSDNLLDNRNDCFTSTFISKLLSLQSHEEMSSKAVIDVMVMKTGNEKDQSSATTQEQSINTLKPKQKQKKSFKGTSLIASESPMKQATSVESTNQFDSPAIATQSTHVMSPRTVANSIPSRPIRSRSIDQSPQGKIISSSPTSTSQMTDQNRLHSGNILNQAEQAFWQRHEQLYQLSQFVIHHSYHSRVTIVKNLIAEAVREMWQVCGELPRYSSDQDDDLGDESSARTRLEEQSEIVFHSSVRIISDHITAYMKQVDFDSIDGNKSRIKPSMERTSEVSNQLLFSLFELYPNPLCVSNMARYLTTVEIRRQDDVIMSYAKNYLRRKLDEVIQLRLKQLSNNPLNKLNIRVDPNSFLPVSTDESCVTTPSKPLLDPRRLNTAMHFLDQAIVGLIGQGAAIVTGHVSKLKCGDIVIQTNLTASLQLLGFLKDRLDSQSSDGNRDGAVAEESVSASLNQKLSFLAKPLNTISEETSSQNRISSVCANFVEVVKRLGAVVCIVHSSRLDQSPIKPSQRSYANALKVMLNVKPDPSQETGLNEDCDVIEGINNLHRAMMVFLETLNACQDRHVSLETSRGPVRIEDWNFFVNASLVKLMIMTLPHLLYLKAFLSSTTHVTEEMSFHRLIWYMLDHRLIDHESWGRCLTIITRKSTIILYSSACSYPNYQSCFKHELQSLLRDYFIVYGLCHYKLNERTIERLVLRETETKTTSMSVSWCEDELVMSDLKARIRPEIWLIIQLLLHLK